MKQIKKLILASLLLVSSLGASELLFDLRAQDYSNTLKADVIVSKYKINDKVILETNLNKSTSGMYYYINDTEKVGFCNIELKDGLKNWTFVVNVIYQSYIRSNLFTDKKRLLRFLDNNGNIIVLEFYRTGFTINGKEFKANIDDSQISLIIKNENNKMTFKMNGEKIYAINTTEFKKLKNINYDLWYYHSGYNKFDRLQDLKLYSND